MHATSLHREEPIPAPSLHRGRRDRPIRRRTGSLVKWSIMHGIPRAMLRRASRKGDLLARLAIEPELIDDPFAAYEELRGRGRLVPGRVLHGSVDHHLVNQVLRSEDFSVGGDRSQMPSTLRRMLDWSDDPYAVGPIDPPSLLAVDPPQHTRYRKLVSRWFTPRRVAVMEDSIRKTAARLLDSLSGQRPGQLDLVEHYAARLPVAVIAELLGVPEDLHDRLLELGNDGAVTLDPGLPWATFRRADRAVRELHTWFDSHLATLRANPGEDLLSGLATLAGQDRLTDDELRATGLLVLGAGFETTVNLIGNAVVALDRNPDQLAVLRADPGLWGNAVEEVLRWDSPVQVTFRIAGADTVIDGIGIPRGRPLLLYLGGANRDPAVFEDPARFDVRRSNADQHLAFSAGVHYCLGANLARLEARVALEELYRRFPDLEVAGQPVRRDTRVLRGFDILPVRLTTRA